MEGMSVTVLMTVYNGGQYLRNSIKSILSQTYDNFEFLIINDCSTDNSVGIIESFHDNRIKIHNNLNNLGQTRSLNVGLLLASGDYIARIDADDCALPRWLETQMSFIETHSDYSVVGVYVFAIDEHNKITKLYRPPCFREDIVLRALVASPINHVGSILKKKDVLMVGGYDEEYKTAADYDLWGKLIRCNLKVTTVPRILMAIREHAQSLSRSERGKRELQEIVMIAGQNIRQFADKEFSDDEIKLFCRANYDEGNLTGDEFLAALNITEKVYKSVTHALGAKTSKIRQWIRGRQRIIYLKRIFSFINQKEYIAVRKLSVNAMREFGLIDIFVVFWGMSWISRVALNFIPDVYRKILKWKARLQLVNQPYVGIFC